MPTTAPLPLPDAIPEPTLWMRAAGVGGGLICVAFIFGALTLTRSPGEAPPEPEAFVARQVALPIDTPPPSTPTEVQLPALASPIRLEIAATTSPVRIQVPEIAPLAYERIPPAARPAVNARFDLARSAVRPLSADGAGDERVVFSHHEVDQRPMALQRVQPKISYMKVRHMSTPRATMLLLVNADGTVGDVRLLHGSQDNDFDEVMMETIREWRFSPAVRKGRKVRCWVEQSITVKVSQGSAFEAH